MDFQNKDNSSNKFVCPSDRQLALRAKLRAGWSTAKSANTVLQPEEQAAIIAVIRRNEDLESAERQRVGRLVERVEKIKQRAAECGPQYCRLCGTAFGLLGPSKLLCEDCRKPVCNKCSIEISSNKGIRQREIWLCKICSETREMWKKSGAWFFKGLPRYEIPSAKSQQLPKQHQHLQYQKLHQQQVNNNNMNGLKTSTRVQSPKLGMKVDDSSSSEDEENADEIMKYQRSNSSSFLSRTDSFRLRTVGSFRHFLDSSERKLSSSFIFFNRQTSNVDTNPTQEWDSVSNSSTINHHNPGSTQRRESTNYRRGSVSSSWSISETSSALSNSYGGGLNSTMNQQYREPPLGWLELSITYSEMDHTLDCAILRARDLPPMDNAGLADPFCKLNIVTPEGNTKQARWLRTKTVHKTRNPEMNEHVMFMGVEPEELGNSILYVVFLDDDKYGHDFLGAAKVGLSPVYNTSPYRITVPLGPEDQYSVEATTSGPWPRGQILLALSYNTKKRALVVSVKRCTNLLPMDNNGSSDPFVKLQLKPDSHRKKYKTSIKWRNLNPIYNEEFQFETRPNDLNKQSLIITVWDKDIGKSNDFLGSLVLGCNSKGRRLKQWTDCVRLPDHFHEQWHCLSNDSPSSLSSIVH